LVALIQVKPPRRPFIVLRAATEHFTPYSGLVGGLLIGAAAFWLMNGRIARVSGIPDGRLFAHVPGGLVSGGPRTHRQLMI